MVDPQALRRMLAEVRRSGFSLSDRQVTMDAISVGAPVLGPHDQVIAALSVVVLHEVPHQVPHGVGGAPVG